MRAGILTGMQRGGIDKFDFIDHDSCLMSGYEAASALAPLADVLVGSEEVTFGDHTLDLDAFASLGDDVSGQEWGVANIEGYARTADKYDGIGDFSALAVVDGDAMRRLDEAVESFADVAIVNMEQIAPQIARARNKSLEFVTGLREGAFCHHRSEPPEERVGCVGPCEWPTRTCLVHPPCQALGSLAVLANSAR